MGSAHKTPQHVIDLLRQFESDPRPKVYITVAGRSNALSAFADGQVRAPVIACPPPSEAFGGGDIFSSLRMPSGIAPAVVLEPANAALLAAKILGLADPAVAAQVAEFQKNQAGKVVADDQVDGRRKGVKYRRAIRSRSHGGTRRMNALLRVLPFPAGIPRTEESIRHDGNNPV